MDELNEEINRAISQYKAGNCRECIKIAEKVIEKDPNNAKGHYLKCIAYYQLKNFHESSKSIDIALQIDPANETYLKASKKIKIKELENKKLIQPNLNNKKDDSEISSSISNGKPKQNICVVCCGLWIIFGIIGAFLGIIFPSSSDENAFSTSNNIETLSNDDQKYLSMVQKFENYNVPLLKQLRDQLKDNRLYEAQNTAEDLISRCEGYMESLSYLQTSPHLGDRRNNFSTVLKLGVEAGRSTIGAYKTQHSIGALEIDLEKYGSTWEAIDFAINRIDSSFMRLKLSK